MKIRSLVAAALPAAVLALAPATDAAASGACVYVTMIRGQKAIQCADGVPNQDVCNRKSITGEGKFHPKQKCSDLDYAFHPGPGPIPPPPAKATVDALRPRGKDLHPKDLLHKGRRDDR